MHPFLIYVQIKFFWIPEPINGRVHRGFNLQVDVYAIHFCCYSDTNNLPSYIFIHKYPAHFSSMGSRLVIETCSLKLNCRKGKWNRRRYFLYDLKTPNQGARSCTHQEQNYMQRDLLLRLFHTYLGRYTGQEQILVKLDTL